MSDLDSTNPSQRVPMTVEWKQALALQRKVDAKAAIEDYRVREQAVRDRTAQLRTERLEREKTPINQPEERWRRCP